MEISIRLKDLFKIKNRLVEGCEREKLKDEKLTSEWEMNNPEPTQDNNDSEWEPFFSQLYHNMDRLRMIVDGHPDVDYRYQKLIFLLEGLNEDLVGEYDIVALDSELYELYTQLKEK